jgi:hypothetical protein
MPSNIVVASSIPAASQTNGNDYTFAFGTVPAGGVRSVVINAEPTILIAAGTVTNVATVTSTDTELNSTNNQDSAWTVIPDTDTDTDMTPIFLTSILPDVRNPATKRVMLPYIRNPAIKRSFILPDYVMMSVTGK